MTSLNTFVYLIIAFAQMLVMTPSQVLASGSDTCAESGHFIASCAYPGLEYVNHALGMYCLNDHTEIFGYNWTWLDLNKCVTNQDGQLVPSTTGGYSTSCFNCEVSNSTTNLTCDCWNTAATNRAETSINLNTVIYNVDGTLGCCDHMGNKTWKGPFIES